MCRSLMSIGTEVRRRMVVEMSQKGEFEGHWNEISIAFSQSLGPKTFFRRELAGEAWPSTQTKAVDLTTPCTFPCADSDRTCVKSIISRRAYGMEALGVKKAGHIIVARDWPAMSVSGAISCPLPWQILYWTSILRKTRARTDD